MTKPNSSAIHGSWAVLSVCHAAARSTVRKTRTSATTEMASPSAARPSPPRS